MGDRISSLPNEILTQILGFLPTREAVRTTVLAKRWNNLWTRVSILYFHQWADGLDFINFWDSTYAHLHYDVRFARLLNGVLFFRDSSVDIKKCTIILCHERNNKALVEDWLCTIARRNIVDLDLVVHFVPQELFRCKSLRILKLHMENVLVVDFDPPEVGCLPNLKVLHGDVDAGQVPRFMKLISRCPVIELLTATFSGLDDDINFTGHELRTLKLRFNSSCHFWSRKKTEIYINAPMLENLHLAMVLGDMIFHSHRLESLVNASIVFGDRKREDASKFHRRVFSLLDIVSTAKCLSLSAGSFLDVLFKHRVLPAFGNLNKLELVIWNCDYITVLAAVLNCAPILKDIIIINTTGYIVEDTVFEWNEPEEVPACLSSHLKNISITGFKGQRAEIEMAKYLLRNASSLKKMTISADISYVEEDWYKEFSLFQMTTACQVEFIMQPSRSYYPEARPWY